ncbi:Anhydro-N-acetylmuramic acid kinase [hydrothermal vent metagenome]|uniref:Anhydro-N-acetylmuramic acid kinase n=1 Tax=hydrothermal vent metagenome TaxID=652676 RepID=A0A3B0R400_9ZZZZ
MLKTEYRVIGVMSGTSLDGVDLVSVTFSFGKSWSFKLHHSQTISYNTYWLNILEHLVDFSLEELQNIDKKYTLYLAGLIKEFIDKFNIENLDAVCSHGHTALHQPEKGLTYQIGNLQNIAELIKQVVVCDFRVQDVALGGQGAPLVPIGDQLLFSQYDFCLNLGGFANVSTDINNVRIAYDVCPVNIVLNHYVKKLGFNYDDEGKVASTGKVNSKLLDKLNTLDFYNLEFPKSLGLEWVKDTIIPLIDAFTLPVKDILRTFVEHIAIQISNEINIKANAKVLVTGGGAFNLFLMQRIKAHTNNEIIIPSKEIIEYKEALIFGFLGVLKLRHEVNCLRSVTGAKTNHSSGKIFQP